MFKLDVRASLLAAYVVMVVTVVNVLLSTVKYLYPSPRQSAFTRLPSLNNSV